MSCAHGVVVTRRLACTSPCNQAVEGMRKRQVDTDEYRARVIPALERALSEAVDTALQERAADPISRVGQLLLEAAGAPPVKRSLTEMVTAWRHATPSAVRDGALSHLTAREIHTKFAASGDAFSQGRSAAFIVSIGFRLYTGAQNDRFAARCGKHILPLGISRSSSACWYAPVGGCHVSMVMRLASLYAGMLGSCITLAIRP